MRTSFLLSTVLVAAAQLPSANAASSSGCGNPLSAKLTRGGADRTNSLNFTTSGGVVRSYLLHIPTSYDANTPAPIAFSYHGRTETPQDQESISGMSNETFNPNYLVVYPQGINLQWQGDPEATGYDDIGFTLELLANLSSTYCIDSSRVYAAGKSNGGGFSANILACDAKASRIFAAFGGMSGAYYQGTTAANCNALTVPITCNPGRFPIPIFTTHGDADGTINYNGGARRGRCLPTLPHFMTEWSNRDGFGTSNTSVSLYRGNVIRYDYGNDRLPGLNTHYYVHGLGHTWPSIAAGAYFDATPLLLAFWNKWTLDSTPYNYVNVVSSSTSSSSISTSSGISTAISSSIGTTISSSTGISTTVTAVNSPASTASALSCPASNNQIYTYAATGAQYIIECGVDHQAGDLSMVYVKNLEACIASCATTSGCVDVSLSGTACYMKKTVGASVSSSAILGARFIGFASSSSVSSTGSTSASSSVQSSSTISASVTSKTSSTSYSSLSFSSSLSSSSSSSFSSSMSSPATVIPPSVGPDGYTTTSFPPTCTAINTNIYAVSDRNGNPYLYMCGGGSAGNTVATITNVANWTACFDACDTYTGCTGFSYNQGANFGNGVGQCLIKTDTPQSFVSTATLLSTRMAGYMRPIPTTSTTSSRTSVSSSSSLISSSSVIASISASPTVSSFITSTLSSKSSISASSSSSVSSSTSSTSSTSSSTSSSTASITSTSAKTVSSTSGVSPSASSSAPVAVAKAVSCPSSHGTVYADTKGVQYTVLCTYDTSINTITTSSSVGSFGDCAVLCDSTSGCSGITFNGTVCSLKQSFGQYILGAVKA